jgi:hypothetical protein
LAVIPAKRRKDVPHVSIAPVAGLAMVVSWNHRHPANERRRTLFNAVKRREKFSPRSPGPVVDRSRRKVGVAITSFQRRGGSSSSVN